MIMKKLKYNPIARALYNDEHGFRKQSSAHKSKKKYTRKVKHRNNGEVR